MPRFRALYIFFGSGRNKGTHSVTKFSFGKLMTHNYFLLFIKDYLNTCINCEKAKLHFNGFYVNLFLSFFTWSYLSAENQNYMFICFYVKFSTNSSPGLI